MPELPEVETTANRLRPKMVGRTITQSRINWGKTLATHTPQEFFAILEHAKVSEVSRRAKYVVVKLELKDKSVVHLLVHLRMSGSLEVVASKTPLPRHERIALILSGGQELRFNDPRKFGRFYLVDDLLHFTRKLGPEPLGSDLSVAHFIERIKQRRGRIKPLLLKQDFIAGVGNIYADEALWRAKISPLRFAEKLSSTQLKALHQAIRVTLNLAIKSAGTDSGDYVIKEGYYRPRVYGRTGLNCFRCKSAIKKIVLGQRGTHYCSKCQR